jgi:hypothetical protein
MKLAQLHALCHQAWADGEGVLHAVRLTAGDMAELSAEVTEPGVHPEPVHTIATPNPATGSYVAVTAGPDPVGWYDVRYRLG